MEEDYVMIPGSGTKKIIRDVKKEIETAFLDYSMSVIVSRALPDVRDGLKPVHRRILYTMHERGNDPSHAYRKSADTVGAVLGSYHPHGDASVYDAMVRLAQDFSLRYPLVDGQGNFGSVDGDPPAAYRYTEARMSRMAVEMLTDIEKDTIDWDPNFDETKKEPSVLPCRFPNLLVNGSSGIAVGMASQFCGFNLKEVCDTTIAYLKNPDCDLMETLRTAKANGAKVILITHYEDSPGAKLADLVLLCGAQESPLDSGSIPIKVAVLYVGEVLVLRYILDSPEQANTAQELTSEVLTLKML